MTTTEVALSIEFRETKTGLEVNFQGQPISLTPGDNIRHLGEIRFPLKATLRPHSKAYSGNARIFDWVFAAQINGKLVKFPLIFTCQGSEELPFQGRFLGAEFEASDQNPEISGTCTSSFAVQYHGKRKITLRLQGVLIDATI